MSSMTRPRGPRPARVYWTRRLLVVVLAFGLVFAIAHLLGAGVGPDKTPAARVVGAPESSSVNGPTPSLGNVSPTTGAKKHHGTKVAKPQKTKTPLAVPTGPCDDSDVQVTPSVDGHAYAGKNVAITLNLTTIESPACTWQVSPQSVVLKLTSGSDRIWSTQDCRAAMPTESVVVRKGHNAKVRVIWNGQRSDGVCSRTTPWAQPGYYHAEAAALGSDPLDVQFELTTPPRPTITAKPKPQHKGQSKTQSQTGSKTQSKSSNP
jgi:hypothetical protein